MRALVVGATGQLGRALVSLLGDQAIAVGGRRDLDLRDAAAVASAVGGRPDVVLNAAAYNNVDGAETDSLEALAVNAAGPRHLARACHASGALLVHVSTDYVFGGFQDRPYGEEDQPQPISAYGVSKLAGELLVRASGVPHLIVRTSGLYGAGGSRDKGGSFIDRILARARAGQPLRVVADQVFSPTYAPDLAAAILALVERGARGLFHVANAGTCSWHGLAVAAVAKAGLSVPVEAIRAQDLGAPARRPRYSVLSTARYESLGLPSLRSWEDALAEFLS